MHNHEYQVLEILYFSKHDNEYTFLLGTEYSNLACSGIEHKMSAWQRITHTTDLTLI